MRKGPLLTFVAASLCGAVSARAQGPQRQPVQLPEGNGKELVEATCASCHGLNLLANSAGYTREGWELVLSSMVALPREQTAVLAEYLAKNFPEKPRPAAVLVPGNVTVEIQEWVVPSLGSRPHDPLAAADGSIWWTGQWSNVLGRLDPKTGAMKEYPLKTPQSGPHGLDADQAGNIWYTGVSKRHVGKLDPNTGEVTEYFLPEGPARGPHTPIFDRQGTLWFTLQSGMVGRLVPATGEMKVVPTPSQNTYPYGIQVNSRGVPWYVDFRGNRIGSVDPATMEIREYVLPDPAARPRRLALTPDDLVWYTDYARGYLGRFDPKTGAIREWPSPGGRESRPYGIAAVGNTIWYSESGVRPNTLVRFDPRIEQFQTWAIPSGGGVVRNMMATADGNLVLACSGVNRVALVEIGGND
ncbi:MAG: cytochrome C [Gemmatimonadetes bacterium]|nr:cytochrome C [Gemmatimonadota bacterium]